MSHQVVHLWLDLDKVDITGDFLDSSQDVTNVCNIANHVFVLLKNRSLYHGTLTDNTSLVLNKTHLECMDIACNSNTLYLANSHGQVLRCQPDKLDTLEEVVLKEDSKCCVHGYHTPGHKIRVKSVAVGETGCLYVTENGQLWASGDHAQLGVHGSEPRRVTFFEKRVVRSVACGADFSLVLVHKPRPVAMDTDSDGSDGSDEGEVFVSTCPSCVSESVSTPASQQSLTPDRCPLGLDVMRKLSEDRYSSSTASRDNTGDDKKSTDESTSASAKDETQLRAATTEPSDEAMDANQSDEEDSDEKKNEFFINTDAARQFLTRQLSWVSNYGGAAGEELLGECAEASLVYPARMIKQNVSNMASLVYEGVKNVGDRVATLSRHMSGGSEDTNEGSTRRIEDLGESFEELNCDELKATASLNSSLRGDDFPWSSSGGTSDRCEESEHGISARVSAMVRAGSALLATELWSWGNISRGQLGTGDMIKRHRPTIVARLSNAGVRGIACGQAHAMAITLDGRAFAWGGNGANQVTLASDHDQSSPLQINSNERARLIGAGVKHSLFTTNEGTVYYLGKHAQSTESTRDLVKMVVNSDGDDNRQSLVFTSARVTVCVSLADPISSAVQDLTIEQTFLEEALLVHTSLIKQLHKKDNIAFSLSRECNAYEALCSCYNDLVSFTCLNVQTLLCYTERGGDASSVTMVHNADEHVRTYRHYLNAVCDVVAISGVTHIAQSIDVAQKLFTVFGERLQSKKSKKSAEAVVLFALLQPLNRLNIYKCMIHSLLRCNAVKDQASESQQRVERRLQDALAKWDRLWDEQERRKKEADVTRQFWETSGRLVELLRSPERRLLRESRSHPIALVNSGRFSSHWFVLLSDVFVHVNGSTQTVHAVPTIWVDTVQDTDAVQNSLVLTMPEDTLTLCCPTPQEKAEWLSVLQNAINSSLQKSHARKPPVVRTATYKYTRNIIYKDAAYVGRWSNGKLHGHGKMEWADGRVYVGKFQNSQHNGFGRMEIPSVSVYEGQWKDGLQNGYGIMKYANGDVYEGYFKDGQAHGHGVRKQGHFMASVASVYIGEWVVGQKQGYGVMDDIITGEKYLGNWNNNMKNGCGLIVTLDGIYYEGNFNQDVLSGYGVMVFEDGTHYEGDFKGVGLFNGKGTLTFLSGDRIDGTLHGAWNEGVKITGTLHKNVTNPPAQIKTNPSSFGRLCVSADQKWKAIFRQSNQQLGVLPEVGAKANNGPAAPVGVDTQKVWDNVAVLISNSHRDTLQRPGKHPTVASTDKLDTIPQFGREKLDIDNFQELRHYLTKAFESVHHPLGRLLSEVAGAYTATYGGVRVHPLLLSHAVAELHSVTSRVYEVVRLLFPALPLVGDELVLNNNNQAEQDCEVVSAASLLHPFLLPRVHSALFVLYALHNKQEDDAYWKRLLKWNKQPDITLMAFLGIDQKFWMCHTGGAAHPPRNGEHLQLFREAVETLQQLKTTFSPLEKLFVIRSTFQQMTRAVQQDLGSAYLWSMDDLFPVFHFVVVRAQILQLGSEIHFVEDFMEAYLQNGELGIMFTTLKACYYQILQEKVSMSL